MIKEQKQKQEWINRSNQMTSDNQNSRHKYSNYKEQHKCQLDLRENNSIHQLNDNQMNRKMVEMKRKTLKRKKQLKEYQ